jgi:hypothetical protein
VPVIAVLVLFAMRYIGLRLCDAGEIKVQMFDLAIKFNRNTMAPLSVQFM